jgi:hypothetical protein
VARPDANGPRCVALTAGDRRIITKNTAAERALGITITDTADSRAPRGLPEVLALSGERDLWLRRVLDASREGYRRGYSDGYDRGYADGAAARKHAQHALADAVALNLRRWDGLRRDFGKPRPGDYHGRGAGYSAAEFPQWPPGIPRPSNLYRATGRQRS